MTKEVLQFSKYSGRFIKEYSSLKEASHQTQTDSSDISKVCRNKKAVAGGYVWRFKSDLVGAIK